MKEKFYNALPYFCLILGLGLTIFFFRNEYRHHALNQRSFYEGQAISIRRNIETRLQTYVDEQIAGAAFVASSDKVSRAEWRNFVEALKLDVNYPGINGLGLSVPVAVQDTLAFVKEVRRDDASNFKITGFRQVDGSRDLFVTRFIEPLARNQQALGLDMGSEPVRRAAMEAARDTRRPVITAKVVLVQNKSQTPGFLIYAPVYKPASKESPGKARFLGWSYAPFITRDFINGILYHELHEPDRAFEIELYDSKATDPDKLMFRSWTRQPEKPELTFDVTFPVYNRFWTLRLLPLPMQSDSKYLKLAYVVLFGGSLLSIMLFLLLNALANTRRKALKLANQMTMELRELNQSLDRKVAERTAELAEKNKQLSNYTENLKNAYEDLEVKVKFRNLQLEKQVKALQEENTNLKNQNG